MSRTFNHIRIRRADDGQALVEYALIIAFVALVSIASLTALGIGAEALLQGIPAGL